MDPGVLFDHYCREIETKFEGWDFSHIQGRMQEFPLSWSYRALIVPYVLGCNCLLDIGTGGGEFLSSLPLPLKGVHATEGYPPNVAIAKARLAPLGVAVDYVTSAEELPFNDQYFDLIISRHESYSESEVFRVLKPGGHFITQQVGAQNNKDINEILEAPDPEYFDLDWTVSHLATQMERVGFHIIHAKEEKFLTRLFDIGALIYFLKAIPWQIPNFSIERYRDKLFQLHTYILEHHYYDAKSQRYILQARKPF